MAPNLRADTPWVRALGTESGKRAVEIGEMGRDGLLQGGLTDENGPAPGVDHPDEVVDGGPCPGTGGSAEAGGAQAERDDQRLVEIVLKGDPGAFCHGIGSEVVGRGRVDAAGAGWCELVEGVRCDPGGVGEQVGGGRVAGSDRLVKVEGAFPVGDEHGHGGEQFGDRCQRERLGGVAPSFDAAVGLHDGSGGAAGPVGEGGEGVHSVMVRR